MTKERRLGRGLEALLGQLPGWSGTTPPGQPPAGLQPSPSAAVPPGSHTPVAGSSSPPADSDSGPATIPIRPLEESPLADQDPNGQSVVATVPRKLPIDNIRHNPHQPRQDFDADELQAWPRASRRMASCSRWWCGHGKAATSLSPANGVCVPPVWPAGAKCR